MTKTTTCTREDLINWIAPVHTELAPLIAKTEISALTADTRLVNSSSVFFAIAGSKNDGHSFLKMALAAHPVAVVVAVDAEIRSGLTADDFSKAATGGTAILRVSDVKKSFARSLNLFYGTPSAEMFVVGVTGTNGKTTTTHLVEFLLNQIQIPTAVMGTINHHLGEKVWETHLTTLGAEDLFHRLSEFRDAGAKAVAMETSSHALAQGRTLSLDLDVGVFMNLTRDHLDYHKTIEDYLKAKQLLFTRELKLSVKSKKCAILNQDDSAVLETDVDALTELVLFGLHEKPARKFRNKTRYLHAKILSRSVAGYQVRFQFDDEVPIVVQSPLVGDFNVENLSAAVAVLDFYLRSHASSDVAARTQQMQAALLHLQRFPGVRGRLERVGEKSPFYIFVDYAHTDDALKNVLKTLREANAAQGTKGELTIVFGCGGDRDKGKRPLMGAIAAELADHVIVTSDNPRAEDPRLIIRDIENGIPEACKVKVKIEPDRARAIKIALTGLRPHDILLVAGKGHETYQIIGDTTKYFDDVEQIKEGLNANAKAT